MLRKVMPYAPYIVVIISLIVAIFMVVTLNGQTSVHNAPKKVATSSKEKTAGKVAAGTEPTYKVRTSPEARPTVTPPPATPKAPAKITTSSKTTTATPAPTAAVATATKGSTELANTGPGEVVALFAVTAAVAAGAHSIYLRRKFEV